ncbi:hypothetical protein [Leifsonia sp. P73]|uniref:hypothetical protein n=1 Tax=Leifsonia sp. P73 TaxID=3423959 RepID=UPI003DA38493
MAFWWMLVGSLLLTYWGYLALIGLIWWGIAAIVNRQSVPWPVPRSAWLFWRQAKS